MTDKNNWVEEFGEHVEKKWNWKTSQTTGENYIGKLPVRCCIMNYVMYYLKAQLVGLWILQYIDNSNQYPSPINFTF